MENILELNNVCLTYFSHNGETEVLNNLNIQVKKGEFVAIVGPSGCGKTTILSLISGLIPYTSGSIMIGNDTISKKTNKTGYMFQKDCLFEWRTIRKNILLGPEISHSKNKKEVLKLCNNYLKKYGLYDFKDKYPNQLSGGMRQRVALIRTLMLKPEILLLDEPFTALDYQTRLNVCNDVYNIIRQENQTAILVTHDIAEAISMADRIIVLTPRPAQLKKTIYLDFDKNLSPLERRQTTIFTQYQGQLWKELQNE